jgi:hypothetical protein
VPDYGLKEALEQALKGGKGARVARPAEKELAQQEADAVARKAAKEAASMGPRTVPPSPGPTTRVNPAEPLAEPFPAETSGLPAPERHVKGQPKPPEPAPVKPVPQEPVRPVAAEVPPESVQPPDIPVAATRISQANLGDYALDEAHMPNFDTITTTDDIKATIAEVAQQNASRINIARRGIITNEQLAGLAADLDLNTDVVQQVLQRESGGVLNPETILAARQVLNSSADRLKTLADKVAVGQATDIEKLQFTRQLQFHSEYQTQFMGARAETGRALNAFRLPVGSDATQIARINELIAGGGADIERMARAIKMADSVSGITQIAKQALGVRAAGASMNLINRIFVNGILSGPTTHLVNMTGNVLFQSMNTFELGFAARLGRFLPGEEHVMVGEALSNFYGQVQATQDAFRLASRAMRTGQTIDGILKFGVAGPSETLTRLPELDRPYLGATVHGIDVGIGLPTRALAAEDELFKTLSYRGYVQRQALLHVQEQLQSGALKIEDAAASARQFMENPPAEVEQAAEDWAREMTFQSPLGNVGQKLQSFLRSSPPLTLIAPFVQTPVNIFKQGVYRSPMALFTARFWRDVKAGGAARDLALTKFGVGSATSAMIAYWTMNGDLTGGGPQNPSARMLWMADGKRPYSIKVTNPVTGQTTWNSYARLEPFASVVGATADTVEIMSYLNSDVDGMPDQEAAYHAAGAIVAGVMNNTGNKTFLKGIADFTDLMNDPTRNIKPYLNQMTVSMEPYSALQRTIRNTEDPYLREAWTVLDKLADNTPGYSRSLPLRLDLFGEPREKNSGSILGTMSPIPESPASRDEVVAELQDVMKSTNIVPVTMPGKSVAAGLGLPAMRLTAAEYAELVTLSRATPIFDGGTKTFHDKLFDVMSSGVYQGAGPVARAELLKMVQRQADEAGRALLEQQNPDYALRISEWRLRKRQLLTGEQ